MAGVPVCRYVDSFDQQTMLEMTRIVSAEGAALVEAQTSALFGDLKQLQRQMQASTLQERASHHSMEKQLPFELT